MEGSSLIGNAHTSKELCEYDAHPNAFEDPDPANTFIPPDALEAHNKIIAAFEDKMYDAVLSGSSSGKEAWLDFISIFRPQSLQVCAKGLTYKCGQLLRSCGVHVDSGRETSRAEFLKRLLLRKKHIPNSLEMAENDDTRATPTPNSENTKHHHGRYRPEGTVTTTINSGNLTSEVMPSQLAE